MASILNLNFDARYGGDRLLALGQDYVVILKLMLPDSNANREVNRN